MYSYCNSAFIKNKNLFLLGKSTICVTRDLYYQELECVNGALPLKYAALVERKDKSLQHENIKHRLEKQTQKKRYKTGLYLVLTA